MDAASADGLWIYGFGDTLQFRYNVATRGLTSSTSRSPQSTVYENSPVESLAWLRDRLGRITVDRAMANTPNRIKVWETPKPAMEKAKPLRPTTTRLLRWVT